LLSNYTYYNHNISNFLCKSCFEHHSDWSISNLLVTYFYYTKVIEIRYWTYQKPNGGPDGLPFYIFTCKAFLFTFLCVCHNLHQTPFFVANIVGTLGGISFQLTFAWCSLHPFHMSKHLGTIWHLKCGLSSQSLHQPMGWATTSKRKKKTRANTKQNKSQEL
jgi:hypothetical protein